MSVARLLIVLTRHGLVVAFEFLENGVVLYLLVVVGLILTARIVVIMAVSVKLARRAWGNDADGTPAFTIWMMLTFWLILLAWG